MTAVQPLSAPITLTFDYTRSLGPVLSDFMSGLAAGRIRGVRTPDGRVIVPPVEFDPATHVPLTELVDVADTGVVETWSWMPEPLEGQPLEQAFAWAMIRLDGADTPLLHAVDAPHGAMRTGLRVRARWADERGHGLRDIVCFEPDDGSVRADATVEGEPLDILITPIRMQVQHSASPQEMSFLTGLTEGRLVGQRCSACGKVYIPPRGACPVDGVPTSEDVELPDRGIITTFCIVNVPFLGQRIQPPYVSAYVLLDGADIAFLHLILECDAADVRMGMRVEAVWKPRDEWQPNLGNITHFRPTGEPDAPYDSFKEHL